MKTRIFWRFLGIRLGLLVMVVPAAQAQNFTFTTIDVPNATLTAGRGIDSSGTAVGLYLDQSRNAHGFLRSPAGVFTAPIDFTSGSTTAVGTNALGIDPAGDFVVGVYFDSAGLGHGFVMTVSTSTFVSFDFPLSGVVFTAGRAINASGEIAGFYVDSAGNTHGFSANKSCLSMSTCFQKIDFPGAVGTQPNGVNDSGDIVGWYLASNSKEVGFLLSGGNFTTLTSPKAAAVLAWGINNSREIAGFFGSAFPFLLVNPVGLRGLLPAPGSLHGYLLAPNGNVTVVNFPGSNAQFTLIFAINDSGMIAGQYNSPGSVTHGFIAVQTK